MRDGIICIDKPAEHTSFDVIARVRGILHMKKVGHAGTLDPMTTGVLPVFLGRATKACDILPVQDKRYRARFQLGVTTDTQDCTGTVLERREVRVSREELIAAIRSFEGEQMQLPPMYSAIQVGGRRLYDIAREGGTVERTPRPVTFYSIEILDLGEDWARSMCTAPRAVISAPSAMTSVKSWAAAPCSPSCAALWQPALPKRTA